LVTASAACSPGTISFGGKIWIWNLPSVASDMVLEKVSALAKMVSRFFGKDEVRRHFSTGCDWAMAGAASRVEPIAPTPADRTNFLRFILGFLALVGL
jgi:hypothetical protein